MGKPNTRQKPQTPLPKYWWDTVLDAMKKVFGHFEQKSNEKPVVHVKAQGFKEGLLKSETVLTAQIFLQIQLHCLSTSRQKGHSLCSLNGYCNTWALKAFQGISQAWRQQQQIHLWNGQIKWLNKGKKEQTLKWNLPHCPRKGQRRKKRALINAARVYEVNVHNIILDTALEAIHRRFLAHGTLFADMVWLDQIGATSLQ